MKKKVIIIALFFTLLFSCSGDNKSEMPFFLNEEYELPEELELYLDKIKRICIYMADRSLYSLYGDVEEWPLNDEKEIRQSGDLFIFNMISSQQGFFIAILLYNARSINIDDNKNRVETKKIDGLVLARDGGCVIDIYDKDDFIIKTYIMQNGLDVFYEKGKEGIYYEMPKLLINKFNLSEKEFLSIYNTFMKDHNRLLRQTK
jgi:hypothetical protein